jgi:tetrapyrrole methylase family protein/MazG family protein
MNPPPPSLGEQFEELARIMEALRGPDGCPWDREQTRASVTPYLIEETYEVVEALDAGDPRAIREELGDLLFQIVFHAQLAREQGEFTLNDVIEEIARKMVHRHPHVFGEAKAKDAEEVLSRWEAQKLREKGGRESVLEGVPRHLPALLRAHRIQEKAGRVGFDWKDTLGVLEKVEEEIREFRLALADGRSAVIEEEIGDLFFALVNLARFVKINPEDALRKTIGKFIHRFRHIEQQAAKQGKAVGDLTIEEMDALWEEAKNR